MCMFVGGATGIALAWAALKLAEVAGGSSYWLVMVGGMLGLVAGWALGVFFQRDPFVSGPLWAGRQLKHEVFIESVIVTAHPLAVVSQRVHRLGATKPPGRPPALRG